MAMIKIQSTKNRYNNFKHVAQVKLREMKNYWWMVDSEEDSTTMTTDTQNTG